VKKIKFTKTNLKALPFPETGEYSVGDKETTSLLLRVRSSGVKTFIVRRKVDKRAVTVSIGVFPDYSLEDARVEAAQVYANIAKGINPNARKRADELLKTKLQEVFDEYLRVRRRKDGKALKELTKKDYRKALEDTCSDWMDRPLVDITKERVKKRYQKGVLKSVARTNNAFRVLRAVFNFAQNEYEDGSGNPLFPINPVDALKGKWHGVEPKETYLDTETIPRWYEAVKTLENPINRAYLLFLLHTGCRSTEARLLQIADVDLKKRSFTLKDPKNRRDVTLPLPTPIMELLKPIIKRSKLYIFEGDNGPISRPTKAIRKVSKVINHNWSLHDLRRTFATLAERDISAYSLKFLINHKSAGDVTGNYIRMDFDELEKATNKVSNRILRIVEQGKKAKVVSFKDRAG